MAGRRPRLTSLSGFGFGAGWEWASTDADIVRRLVVFLEDRRALAYGTHREDAGHVVSSVLQIRIELTNTLKELAPTSGASQTVRTLRDACLVFLDRTNDMGDRGYDGEFADDLRELQDVFGYGVRGLADAYDITVHAPLAVLLEAIDAAEDSADGSSQ